MSDHVGTWAWAQRTGGVIGLREKVLLARLGGVLGLHLPRYALYRAHLWPNGTAEADCGWTPPCGAAARAAREQLAEIAPEHLLNHCLRTYWLSRTIAASRGHTFDDELLYVASLAHDVGLLDGHGADTGSAPCFSVRGARWAMDLARTAGWTATRVGRLADAITLNVNGTVPARRGIEARAMMLGVLADVTGMHRWRVHPDTLRALYTEFPLRDQRPELERLFTAEADRHVDCRGHFATHWLGFGLLMRHAPPVPVAPG